MRYRSATAFRQALLDHLRNEVRRTGQDFQWFVRRIAFERLLARLVVTAPKQWVLKGGLALDFRLSGSARTTQDVDLAWLGDADAAETALLSVRQADLGDYFTLHVVRTTLLDGADVGGAVRFRVACELAARHLTGFHLDIGFGNAVLDVPDDIAGLATLSFSDLPNITVPVLPLAQHVAEKVHAYTRQYGAEGRQSTRVKDLVDVVLIQARVSPDAGELWTALRAVFEQRKVPPLPSALPPPPVNWSVPYRRMAASLDIPTDIQTGYRLAGAFLDPVLSGSVPTGMVWSPALTVWADPPEA